MGIIRIFTSHPLLNIVIILALTKLLSGRFNLSFMGILKINRIVHFSHRVVILILVTLKIAFKTGEFHLTMGVIHSNSEYFIFCLSESY